MTWNLSQRSIVQACKPSPTAWSRRAARAASTLLLLAAVLASRHRTTAAERTSPIRIHESDEGFLFTEGKSKVLFYQRAAKSLDGKFRRAHYVHPLYDLDGKTLTEDFPKDHPHHRGIFWAWHQVWVGNTRVGDPWALKDFSWDVAEARTLPDDGESAALKLVVLWKSPLWTDADGNEKPIVEETAVIRAHRTEGDVRKIDFQFDLLAREKQVRIGGSENAKGYGGFSVRVRLPDGTRFTGAAGDVEPRRLSVEAGSWVDITAPSGSEGNVTGLGILCHPTLPGFPQPWVLRRKGSMQNPAYPGQHPVALSTEKPLTFRYRLVVHRGGSSHAGIARLQSEYEQHSSVTATP